MKINLIKKSISGILIIAIVFLTSFSIQPKKAEALLGVGDVTFDPTNFGESVINVANTTASSLSNSSVQFKEYVLDPIASGLAKAIIRQLTASIVNWINSGFQGSPAFVTNPGAFFLDMADQVTGDFLAKNGGPLTDLCSPFSIDIRIALSFKYHPKINQRYACTLGTIIKNSKNAIAGASINGFTAGDFKQGGWPAFVSLTTEPQNNVYGAYLTADSELSVRVANAQIQQKDELNQGKGFLSWKKCTNGPESNVQGVNQGSGEGTYTGPERSFEGTGEGTAPQKTCEIQTPGSVIVSTLEDNINGPLHELQLADELNEIVNALFAQLATTVLSKGLGAVSGSSPSDSSSYIYQIQQESKTNTTQLDPLRNEFLKNVETYITNTLQYKNNKDQSLNLMLDMKNSYESAKGCYSNKIITHVPPYESQEIAQVQDKINAIDATINASVTPLATDLLNKATEADTRYTTLVTMKNQAIAAQTVNDLNDASQKFSQMLQTQSVVTPKDIGDSKQELDNTTAKASDLKQDAQRKLQECQVFP